MPTTNLETQFVIKSNLKCAGMPHVKKIDRFLYLHFYHKLGDFPSRTRNRMLLRGQGWGGARCTCVHVCATNSTWRGSLVTTALATPKAGPLPVLENTGLPNGGHILVT